MTGVGFIILFGASFVLFPCQGEITSPPDGTRLYFLNGSTVNITWSFNDKISDVNSRVWYFTSSDGSIDNKRLGRILGDVTIQVNEASGLSGVKIERPASLILENINLTYNGTYQFGLSALVTDQSEVVVFIAIKPNVIINCSDPTTVNEEKDLTCVCRSEGGNPQANLTWYDKDGVQIGKTGYGENILTLTNVTKQCSGRRYKCKGQSYILTDEKSFEVKVTPNFKPNKTEVTFINHPAVVGEKATVKCSSNGRPEPSYTIMHNNSITVSNQSTYNINVVKWSDAGTYKCIATNKLGSDSASKNLTVGNEHGPTTSQSATPTSKTRSKTTTVKRGNGTVNTAANKEDDGTTVVVWHIVVSLVSGIIIGILLSYIVWCSRRRWFRPRKPERNPEPQTNEVDTTYQELDLTKMNKEDNYQSLKVNAASNDDDSTYTELNKTRDVENNYQSLT